MEEKMIATKKMILYFKFYKSFCFTSIVISLTCAVIFFINGIPMFLPLFWFKMITLALFFYVIKSYKEKEFYFYKNLGISQKSLWVFSASIDLILYFVLIITALNLHGKFT